ncbi:hypothetical protein DIPPA_00664 [Diplonema papillatum]|nr:hypothetical protein DIPPA_00664 [Diplonema papillatum]
MSAQQLVKDQNDAFRGLMEFKPRQGPVLSSRPTTRKDANGASDLDEEKNNASLEGSLDKIPSDLHLRRPTLALPVRFDMTHIMWKVNRGVPD